MGVNATRRRSSSIHRKKSILSHSVSSTSTFKDGESTMDDDVDEKQEEAGGEDISLSRTLSEKKRLFLQKVLKDDQHTDMTDSSNSKNTDAFDRDSTSIDDSRINTSRADRSLLRRSAFSARGRSRRSVTNNSNRAVDGIAGEMDGISSTKFHRRSLSQREAATAAAVIDFSLDPDSSSNAFTPSLTNFTRSNSTASSRSSSTTSTSAVMWDKVNGISLMDQSTRKADYIDMGNELENPTLPMLSRVQEAESQVLSSSSSQLIAEEQLDNISIKLDKKEDVLPSAVLITKEKLEDELIVKEPEKPVIPDDVITEEKKEGKQPKMDEEKDETIITAMTTTEMGATLTKSDAEQKLKRPTIIRSESDIVSAAKTIPATTTSKPAKRNSWFSGLFTNNTNDKKTSLATKKEKEKAKKAAPTTTAVTTTNNNTAASAFSGFASIFTRSLSKSSGSTPTITPANITSKSKSKQKSANEYQKKKNASVDSSRNKANDKTSKSKYPTPPTHAVTVSTTLLFNSNRLPLHVERAIYRLSHMKLADIRRPLRQQVLISNLMFWYLSIQQSAFRNQTTSLIPEHQQQQSSSYNNIPSSLPKQQQSTAKKPPSKMSKFISSAKKRRNEMAQFVQNYPVVSVEIYQRYLLIIIERTVLTLSNKTNSKIEKLMRKMIYL
ncbi:hypothetical protein BDF20DRAFT_467526 [Mycotypha africana]|uniref:uncharacterized protein n=1 Tax=Mycotypha africana TaxID=64632 RepID=UPI002301EC28|nr:uncharacterized protein BDF20DRAFT_467526 [Mycotypha africana]KAI8982361.1 hypothetical protein BDF20DRAFT_467526 [Mycotypha africana]